MAFKTTDRAAAVAAMRANNAIEGIFEDAEAAELFDAYGQGEISLVEIRERFLAEAKPTQ